MASEKTNKTQQEPAEQTGFLAMIDAKIAALQNLRASFLTAASVGAMAEGADLAGAGLSSLHIGGGAPMELPRGALLGKSLPAAIKLYLAAVKKKQTIKEIATALKEGGVETTAKNLDVPISSAINRLKTAGEVLRFNDGWALAEFYPEHLRNRIVKDARPAKKRGTGKKTARTQKNRKTEAKHTTARAKATPTSGPGLEERLKAYLQTRGSEFTTIQELITQLKVESVPVLRMTLGKMIKQERVEKNAEGRYRMVKKAA